MSVPENHTRPAVGRNCPAMTLSSVDLPLPFGPTTPTTSNGATQKSMSSSVAKKGAVGNRGLLKGARISAGLT
jgi:hypothetical protein